MAPLRTFEEMTLAGGKKKKSPASYACITITTSILIVCSLILFDVYEVRQLMAWKSDCTGHPVPASSPLCADYALDPFEPQNVVTVCNGTLAAFNRVLHLARVRRLVAKLRACVGLCKRYTDRHVCHNLHDDDLFMRMCFGVDKRVHNMTVNSTVLSGREVYKLVNLMEYFYE